MRFGLFGSAQARRGGPDTDSSQGFRDFVENNVEAEALGYYSTFLVEHHFTGFGQVSASLNLLTWLGARTTPFAARHRGAGPAVAQSRAAGRAGRHARPACPAAGSISASARAIATTNSPASAFRWRRPTRASRKSLDVITKAWTSRDAFSHRGKYWQFENIVVEPPTAQKPHPPFWMGAGSPNSVRKVAGAATTCCSASTRSPRNPRPGRPIPRRGRGARPPLRPDARRRRAGCPYRQECGGQRGRARAALSGTYADQCLGADGRTATRAHRFNIG